MTDAAETPDLMARIARFYRLSVIGKAGAFRGVITHKATGKSLTVDVPCRTESAAALAARAHLTGAVRKGTLPLAERHLAEPADLR
ncbi:MAG: hypothetical protein ACJ8H8_20435 [Geminicoccaceae bacterium]